MDQFFSWGWQGVLLIGILMTMWRVIPVAFDAWRSGNLIVGTVKTIGPVLSIGVIAIGGYMVIRESLTYIVSDAKSSGFYNDINSWSNSGSSTFGNAAEDVGSYFESFKSEYNSASSEAVSEERPSESAAPAASGQTQTQQQPRPQATARPTQGPEPKPWFSVDWATATPAPVQGPAPRPTSWAGGGGPSVAEADQAMAAATREYTVRSGDDLSKISIKFYGDKSHAGEICRVNNIRNCNVINVGTKLVLP